MPSASLSPGSPSSSFKLNLLPHKFRKSPSPPPPPDIVVRSPTTPGAGGLDSPYGSAPTSSSFANFRPGSGGGSPGSSGGGAGGMSSTYSTTPSSGSSTATATTSTTRSRSSSQPMRPSGRSAVGLPPQLSRHSSHLNFRDAVGPPSLSATVVPVVTEAASAADAAGDKKKVKGRGRSASLVTVTQVGGEEMDGADMGTLGTQNWDWLDSKGAWAIHPILILIGKFVFDSIPGVDSDLSWTLVTCGYMAVSYLIFHQMTGLPFENTMATGGAYDELTLWEQIDNGAQYTPAKKWLTSVPIGLFLISTHYTKYDPVLFSINTFALTCVLIPKLPALHRLRFHFLGGNGAETSSYPTPANSRPSSPQLTPVNTGSGGRSMRASVEPEDTILEEDEGSHPLDRRRL